MRVFAGGTAGRVDMGAYLPLELVLQASQRGGLVRRHGRAAETPRAHRGARQRERHRRERQHGRARSGLMVETEKRHARSFSREMLQGGFIIYPPPLGPARCRDGVPADARCGRAVPKRRRPFRETRVRLVRDAVRPGVRHPRVPARRTRPPQSQQVRRSSETSRCCRGTGVDPDARSSRAAFDFFREGRLRDGPPRRGDRRPAVSPISLADLGAPSRR